MLRRLTLLSVLVALVASIAAPAAGAADPPIDLQFACAQKGAALMRAATDPGECDPKKETLVTFSVAAPVIICVKPDGSVRLGGCSGPGMTLSVPSNTPAYFCANLDSAGKVLKWVTDPASCEPGDTAFVVGNHAPTDIALSNASVAENEPAGTTVGTLTATDADAGETFTFTLVSGAGSADNGSFQITGSTLRTNAVFDYEAKSSYSIRIRVTDQLGLTYEEAFTIAVTDIVENAPPTDIQLSNASVAENQPAGTTVGALTTTDPDPADTHTYTLVAGTGDADNAKFQISGSTLQTAQPLDFEADSSLQVRIRTDDGNGGTFEEPFTITVLNANDAPTAIALSNSSVAENQPAGTTVGALSATDQDAGAVHTFTLVAGTGDADNAKFQIVGATLQTAQPLDFEADASLTIRVRVTDNGGAVFETSLAISVTNVNEAPTDIALSNASVPENQPVGTAVGTLSASDPDAGDTHTFTLVSGAGSIDNASFQINGLTLRTNAVFDFETKSSYSIRVRATDAGGLFFEESLTITITNVNEPPSDVNLSNTTVLENQPVGTAVGTLSTVDEPGSTHTYSLVAGAGDTDNASFQIDGNVLETNAIFDFEAKSSYSVRIRTDDGAGGTFEKQFTISVLNANDAPTDIALSNASVNENEPITTSVGSLSATDQDVGDTHTFTLVAGAGDTDNASFQIVGSTLRTNAVFNFEVKSSYSIRIRVTDTGGATFEEVFTVTIVDVNDPPVAGADSYGNAVGNTLAVLGTAGSGPHIVLTGSLVITNDTDEDATFPHTLSAVAETVASTGGGTATINADGSFTFLPGVGDKNQNDTFTYHVTDGAATSAGTVTVTIANVLVWYVNASAGPGDGRSSSPLNTLSGVNGAGGAGDSDGSGDIIFLYSGTYAGGLPLEASQKLLGQPHGLTVNPGSGDVTLVPAGGTNPTIGNAGGAGLGLANGVEVQRVNVNGTTGAGVTGASVTTALIGGNTSIGGTTGNAFELSGAASGNIDVGSTISSATARSISVQNRTGGVVTFSGNVSDTGQGILLNSNSGATVNLTGSLTISTAANAGFTATGGGTVNASNAANTIATTTGTALNVQNTTIGSSGLTFRSIASNGAASGIVLNNTGATAGLTVTGTGSAGTGGTIQNSTGAGISLTSTRSPSFSWMNVQAGGDDGIRGLGVVNFTLANSSLTNNGNAVNEHAIDFVGGLTGTASITTVTVDTYAENGLIVTNASGSLNLTVTGSTFKNASATVGNDGIHLDSNNTAAMTASVTGSTFDNNRGDHFQFSTNATSTGSNSVTFSGNTLTGDRGAPFGNDLGAGVTISTTGGSQTSFTVANNNIQGAVFPTIGVDLGTASTAGGVLSGTINANTIGNAAVAASGGSQSSSIAVVGQGAGTVTVGITNNVIRQNDGFAGIDILSRDGSPTINATVTGNNIANAASGGGNGFLLRNGAITTDGGLTCLVLTGNTLAGSAAAGFDDFRVRQRFNTTVRLPGYGGAAGNTGAVVAFIQANNPGAETGSATADFPVTGGGFVGGAVCPTP